ncbi:MAG: hypothetical protein AAFV33_24930 [Chloroflexota bacterium]
MDGIISEWGLLVIFVVGVLALLFVVPMLDGQGRNAEPPPGKPRERKRKAKPKRQKPQPEPVTVEPGLPASEPPEVPAQVGEQAAANVMDSPYPPPIPMDITPVTQQVSPEEAAYDEEMHEYIDARQKIRAIKRYRALTGVSLREAKDAVEAIAAGVDPNSPAPSGNMDMETALQDKTLLRLVLDDRKLESVDRLTALTGVDNATAIEAIIRLQLPESVVDEPISHEDAQYDEVLTGHVNAGETIEAIKRYRALTHSGLKEAQDAVNTMMGTGSPMQKQEMTVEDALHDEILLGHMDDRRKILAIKRLRELTRVGLKEAKEAIDGLE